MAGHIFYSQKKKRQNGRMKIYKGVKERDERRDNKNRSYASKYFDICGSFILKHSAEFYELHPLGAGQYEIKEAGLGR